MRYHRSATNFVLCVYLRCCLKYDTDLLVRKQLGCLAAEYNISPLQDIAGRGGGAATGKWKNKTEGDNYFGFASQHAIRINKRVFFKFMNGVLLKMANPLQQGSETRASWLKSLESPISPLIRHRSKGGEGQRHWCNSPGSWHCQGVCGYIHQLWLLGVHGNTE